MAVFIDEILAENVVRTQTVKLDQLKAVDPNITGIHFKHGHPLEIIDQLKELSLGVESKTKRYPLVALFRDFPEDKGQEIGIYSEPRLNLIIATRTEPTYNSDERKENSFKPILYPIWEELEKQLLWDSRFNTSGIGLSYTQIDHYFWGRQGIYGVEGNIFNDWIDCIEIRDLNLKVKQPNC